MNTEHRQLHPLAWVMAALFFPMGTFLALGFGRVLLWRRAIILAIISALLLVGVVAGMAHYEEESIQQSFTLFCGMVGYYLAGRGQYYLGNRASYWTDAGRRIWRIFGILALGCLVIYPVFSIASYCLRPRTPQVDCPCTMLRDIQEADAGD